MSAANSTKRWIKSAAALAVPVLLAAIWTTPASSYAAPSNPAPPTNPQNGSNVPVSCCGIVQHATAPGPGSNPAPSNPPITTYEASVVSPNNAAAPAAPAATPSTPSGGGGGGGGGAKGSPVINPSPVSNLVSANTVVMHNVPSVVHPPASPPPAAPPPASNNPAPQQSPPAEPPAVPQQPQAPVTERTPLQAVDPTPVQNPLHVDTVPLGRTQDVMLTNSVDAGTSAEIIILVLLTIGIWYYSHRVIVQLTARKPQRA